MSDRVRQEELRLRRAWEQARREVEDSWDRGRGRDLVEGFRRDLDRIRTGARGRGSGGQAGPTGAGDRAGGWYGTPADAPADRLAGLSVESLHRLEQVDALLRHSVIRACFYNLSLYSEILAERPEDPAAHRGLLEALRGLPLARDEVEAFAAVDLGDGATPEALFPEHVREVRQGMDRLRRFANGGEGDEGGEGLLGASMAGRLRELATSVLEALRRISEELAQRKIDVLHVLRAAVDLLLPRAAAAGVEILLSGVEGALKVFGHRGDLIRAFAEVLTNALKYAFDAAGQGERPGKVVIDLDVPGSMPREVVVRFDDNGAGFPPELEGRLGQRGASIGGTGEGLAMVRDIVENRHAGRVEFGRSPFGGARVEVALPLRIVPAASPGRR